MRQVAMASRRLSSRSLSTCGLGPGRMASPSASASTSMSVSMRASESLCSVAPQPSVQLPQRRSALSEPGGVQGVGRGREVR